MESRWMDGCLLFFVQSGSMTQLSATGTGTGRLKGNSLFYQSSQTSHNNLTSQLASTCHISFDVCLSDWGSYTSSPSIKKQDMSFFYFEQSKVSTNVCSPTRGIMQMLPAELCKSFITARPGNKARGKKKKDAYK